MWEYLFLIVVILVLGEVTAFSCTGRHLFVDWRLPKKKKNRNKARKKSVYRNSELSRVYPISRVSPREEEQQ